MKVIAYTRISHKDQSNFSLEFQTEMIERFCADRNYQIISSFQDNGQSARNFDRREWQKLETYLKANRSKIYAIVVAKYDRMIRNVAEGLAFVNRIESKLGIRVLSAMEPISLDPYDPMFFKLRADMFVQAEFELRYITHRTQMGIYQARKSGRIANRAPWPYENARDAQNKPVIVLNNMAGAAVIEFICKAFANGQPIKEIAVQARKMGFPGKGNSSIQRVIENPILAGLITVPSFRGQPETIVQGLHPACYQERLFWENQERINGYDQSRYITTKELPIRGFLTCDHCGRILTGGRSRSKTGRYYWYYRCLSCRNANHNAGKVHTMIADTLTEISLPSHYLEYIEEKVAGMIDTHLRESQSELRKVETRIEGEADRIDQLEQRFISGEIPRELFDKWSGRYAQSLYDLKSKAETLKTDHSAIWRAFLRELPKLADLGQLWKASTPTNQLELARHFFPGGLSIDRQGLYSRLNPALLFDNSRKFNNLQVKKDGKTAENTEVFPIVPGAGTGLNPGNVRKLVHLLQKCG